MKGRLLGENAQRLESTLEQLHRCMDDQDVEGMARLQKVVAGLEAEQATLRKIPTWPWQPETVRLLVTAVGLPLALWMAQLALQYFLSR